MDAEYLKSTVYEALQEALTATVLANPDDKIDYLGKYLLMIIDRREKNRLYEVVLQNAAEAAELEALEEKLKIQQIKELESKKAEIAASFTHFKNSTLASAENKQQLLNMLCNFTASHLKVPAVYIGLRNTTEDKDILDYISANESQTSIVVGKRLIKLLEDNDEIGRQGISFDAFEKPSESEYEESTGETDDDDVDIPKTEPKLQPMIIENVLRNSKCKFFGTPKLGSLIIIPLSYESSDHDTGCNVIVPTEVVVNLEGIEEEISEEVLNEEGEDESKDPVDIEETKQSNVVQEINYEAVKNKKDLILVADTIGSYRQFKAQEIEVLESIGAELVHHLSRIEELQWQRHVQYLRRCAQSEKDLQERIARTIDAETTILAAIDQRFNPPEPDQEEEESGDAGPDNEDEDDKQGEDEVDGDIVDENERKVAEGENDLMETVESPNSAEENEPPHDLLQPFKMAEASEKVWKDLLLTDDIMNAILGLRNYELPAPASIFELMKILSILLDIDSSNCNDIFGEKSWDLIKTKLLPELKGRLESYSVAGVKNVEKENTLEAVKELCETSALFDATTYSDTLPSGVCAVITPLRLWLQKALDAREVAISYHREAKEVELEVLPTQTFDV